jgi:hypothetical protein
MSEIQGFGNGFLEIENQVVVDPWSPSGHRFIKTLMKTHVMNQPVPSPAASLQIHMNLSPSLVPCFRALALALAIYVLALAYAHVASTF